VLIGIQASIYIVLESYLLPVFPWVFSLGQLTQGGCCQFGVLKTLDLGVFPPRLPCFVAHNAVDCISIISLMEMGFSSSHKKLGTQACPFPVAAATAGEACVAKP